MSSPVPSRSDATRSVAAPPDPDDPTSVDDGADGAGPRDDEPALRAGRLIRGRYRLVRRLASGGMAQVWEGTDDVLRRTVAVKVLHPHLAADDVFVARFRQEAVAAARLAHPNIVAIFDTCSDEGVEAIVMELVEGPTLRELLDRSGPIDAWRAAGIAAQVAEALHHAHAAGLVHRDIKPGNVLVCPDGRIKVTDFGIAKAAADADLTQPGLMVGTAKYLAPEQVTGDPVDPRSDIYSLGVVLYELLCGRPPYHADTDTATALARLHRDPLLPRQVRPGVPRQLEEITCRAMARRPADRFPSAADLRAALLAAGADADPVPAVAVTGGHDLDATAAAARPDTAMAPSPHAPAPSFTQTERSWLIPTLLVVLVAAAVAVAGLLLGRSGAGTFFDGVRQALGRSSGEPATIVGAAAFDPFGDQHENDDRAALAVDGDVSTAWTTERYDDRDITLLKPGVGLVIELDGVHDLHALELVGPTNGWRAEIHVADAVPARFEDWGEPVHATGPIPAGSHTIELEGARGGAVLLWIVDRGDGHGSAGRVEVQEALVR